MMIIPLSKPYFDTAEEQAVAKVLRSGWVTQGPKVGEFENKIAEYTGAVYAVATTSCTTALSLSLYALGIGSGDEVIVPSFSFIATANSVVHVGATPVFVDINLQTYNMDPDKIEGAVTKRTRAIIPVDQVGLPADLDKIHAIAKKHNLFVVEDAACAIGSVYRGKKIGGIGDVTCLSFHPRKIVVTGEGGMILTNSKNLANKLRILRHHGMSISDVIRHKSKKIIFESYSEIGYNYRMSDINAAIGVEQMKKLPQMLKKRTEIAKKYTKSFLKSQYIIPPFVPEGSTPNWQSYIILLKKNKNISRNILMQKMKDAGVSARIGIMAAHLEKPYKIMYPSLVLPETEFAARETIALPLYFQMTEKEQDYVIDKLIEFTEG